MALVVLATDLVVLAAAQVGCVLVPVRVVLHPAQVVLDPVLNGPKEKQGRKRGINQNQTDPLEFLVVLLLVPLARLLPMLLVGSSTLGLLGK